MKTNIYTFISLLFLSTLTMSAQEMLCGIEGGGAVPTSVEITSTTDVAPSVCPFTLNSLSDYDMVITSNDINDIIVGISQCGDFDFAADTSFAFGTYTFTPFSYNQAELNSLVLLLNVLGIAPIELSNPAELSEIFEVFSILIGPTTIVDVEEAICNFLPTLTSQTPLLHNVGYEYQYEIDYVPTTPDTSTLISEVLPTNVTISPVPATQHLDVVFEKENRQPKSIKVYDISGKLIDSFSNITNRFRLDVSAYQTGMYFLHLDDNISYTSRRFYKL